MAAARTWEVYILLDPRHNNEVRYVGAAKRAKSRLTQHMAPSELIRDTPRSRWFKELIANSALPVVVVVDWIWTATPEEVWALESTWTAEYLRRGANLLNIHHRKGTRTLPSYTPPPKEQWSLFDLTA